MNESEILEIDFSTYLNDLTAFIAMESISGNTKDNADVVEFLRQRLIAMGFEVDIHGTEQTEQPLIVAKRLHNTGPALVMYNHYDVEVITQPEKWMSAPFTLIERDERIWARGIADNKAVLLARMVVLERRIQQGLYLPDLVWLIQGEEEVGSSIAHQMLPDILSAQNTFICLEETGYVRNGVPLIFYRSQLTEFGTDSKATELTSRQLDSLNTALFSGCGRYENRTLSKFGPCPMVSNLPMEALYLGFGPNDYQARIHRDNESMNLELLQQYFPVFDRFLDWTINELTHANRNICSGNECVV